MLLKFVLSPIERPVVFEDYELIKITDRTVSKHHDHCWQSESFSKKVKEKLLLWLVRFPTHLTSRAEKNCGVDALFRVLDNCH